MGNNKSKPKATGRKGAWNVPLQSIQATCPGKLRKRNRISSQQKNRQKRRQTGQQTGCLKSAQVFVPRNLAAFGFPPAIRQRVRVPKYRYLSGLLFSFSVPATRCVPGAVSCFR